jgi:cytochrome c biogenesis factor
MKLRYETGTATLIQLGVVTLLGFINQVGASVSSCLNDASECVGDSFVSLVFVILLGVWLGIVSTIGYAAEEKRSRRLAIVLIGCEFLIFMVAAFNARHTTNLFERLTSLTDLFIAIWIMVLAFRLARANGGRIVSRSRASAPTQARRRPTPLDRP